MTYLTLGLLAAAFLSASLAAESFSAGILRSQGFTDEGCICHGPNAADDGVPNPDTHVLFRIEPSILRYAPGNVYNLTVGVAETDVPRNADGNKGGFNLLVSLGTLEAGDGYGDYVKFEETALGHEATHTLAGDRHGRTWNLTWTAPAGDDGPAVFTLFVNAVQGNAQPDADDHWNGRVVVIPGPSGELAIGAEDDPSKVGVTWLAHWVGIISFLAVVVTLVIYYFVLKYSESIHTTDHRDRQEK